MIRNSVSQVLSAHQLLVASSRDYHLTGSRFFGTAREDSDWDYFVEWDKGVYHELCDFGFVLDHESYAHDPNNVAVFVRDDVHVQVVGNAAIKERIQYQLRPIFTRLNPSKENAKIIWRIAFNLYRDGWNWHTDSHTWLPNGIATPSGITD